jgi:hypothetical protein
MSTWSPCLNVTEDILAAILTVKVPDALPFTPAQHPSLNDNEGAIAFGVRRTRSQVPGLQRPSAIKAL